jgi:hypothetical protein
MPADHGRQRTSPRRRDQREVFDRAGLGHGVLQGIARRMTGRNDAVRRWGEDRKSRACNAMTPPAAAGFGNRLRAAHSWLPVFGRRWPRFHTCSSHRSALGSVQKVPAIVDGTCDF